MSPERETVRLAAVADLHCLRTSAGELAPLFLEAAAVAGVPDVRGLSHAYVYQAIVD